MFKIELTPEEVEQAYQQRLSEVETQLIQARLERDKLAAALSRLASGEQIVTGPAESDDHTH